MLSAGVAVWRRPDRVQECSRGNHADVVESVTDGLGCLRRDVHRDTDRPHEFVLHEIYPDQDALYTGHRNALRFAAWCEVARRCLEEGGQVVTMNTPAFPRDLSESPQKS